ncbi:hypothetical protein E2C01_050411 [Portunus trituberculatus]|uniref:Uncharacterized protein n=1 Tax=Portunus trituberculatus TaxID=210409 RepID=A0A5B7G871_PORTR|nr:hypothetical protein [Portunus trituberculatus]
MEALLEDKREAWGWRFSDDVHERLSVLYENSSKAFCSFCRGLMALLLRAVRAVTCIACVER